jgi:N-acetylglutamate synthase-like GNAT family acetyltransferase
MDEERTPPTRIRVTRLQEAQLSDLARIERACAEIHYEAGFNHAQIVPRTDAQIAQLYRTYDVYVAEADNIVAGYLGWRDEPPKVGCLYILNVAPEYQRFGVATRLLREMGERCQENAIRSVVARCWTQATWAHAFLASAGFKPLNKEGAPPPVAEWRERAESNNELVQPGQVVLWRAVAQLGMKIIPGVPLPS